MSLISSPVLTPNDHAFFLEHGYLVVKNVVPPELIAEAVEALEHGTYQGQPGAADYQAIADKKVTDCITDMVHDAIGEMFGSNYPFARIRSGFDMPRPYQPDGNWPEPKAHIDDDYPTLMPYDWALGTFLFLTPLQSRGGAFVLFSGSYRRYHKLMLESPEMIKGSDLKPENSGPSDEFLADPGDLLIFHHLMGHSGSNNISDPRTRHALLSRWHPDSRIVPGDKSFDQMSTIEKANSRRFLQEQFGTQMPIFGSEPSESADSALQNGFALTGDILAQTTLVFAGRVHLFSVDSTEPNRIRHDQTRNLVDWEFIESLPEFTQAIETLAFFQRGAEVFLIVGAGDQTQILTSTDLRHWTPVETAEASRFACGNYSTNFGSKIACGNILFYVSPDSPSKVECRWGKTWSDTGSASETALVAEAAPGQEIRSLCVKPVLGEGRFALVADLKSEGSEGTKPHVTLSRDSVSYPERLVPLAYTAPTAPHHLGVCLRARNYWLVTYVRHHQGQDRLFWGNIDWEQSPATLTEIDTVAALDNALYIAGVK